VHVWCFVALTIQYSSADMSTYNALRFPQTEVVSSRARSVTDNTSHHSLQARSALTSYFLKVITKSPHDFWRDPLGYLSKMLRRGPVGSAHLTAVRGTPRLRYHRSG